jgi:tRNA nucleotidyltransferase/poly(A) polymerase
MKRKREENKDERERIFQNLSKLIVAPTPYKSTTLFHHVHSLKLGDEYVFKSEEQFIDLVRFLNDIDNRK